MLTKHFLRIRCAICDKMVDEVVEMFDDRTREVNLKVCCHGDTDYMQIPSDMIIPMYIDQLKNQEGIAFSVKRIGAETRANKTKAP
jgi:hypothetical protein